MDVWWLDRKLQVSDLRDLYVCFLLAKGVGG
jgi:hypothetical protein